MGLPLGGVLVDGPGYHWIFWLGAISAGLGDPLFWWSLAIGLLIAGVVAYPVNRWLLTRGKGHAVRAIFAELAEGGQVSVTDLIYPPASATGRHRPHSVRS